MTQSINDKLTVLKENARMRLHKKVLYLVTKPSESNEQYVWIIGWRSRIQTDDMKRLRSMPKHAGAAVNAGSGVRNEHVSRGAK